MCLANCTLTVAASGSVAACCAGSSVTPANRPSGSSQRREGVMAASPDSRGASSMIVTMADKKRQIEREFGVPIAGEILPPEQWAQTALKKLPPGLLDWEQ